MEEIKKYIDYNCNLNELFQYQAADDELEIMDSISSVNISCGVHEGTPLDMKRTIEKCKFKNKVIGASIGLPKDVVSPLELSDEDIEAIVLYQLGAISAFAKANSMNIEYVRPDGILYQLTATNIDYAIKIAKAISKYSKWLLLYLFSGSTAREVASTVNINIAKEIVLNGIYTVDGLLDFSANPLTDNGLQLIRLRRLMNLGEIEVAEQTYAKFDFDTVHLDLRSENLLTLVNEAKNIAVPRPVNFNRASETGWVGINRNHYLQENNFEKNNK